MPLAWCKSKVGGGQGTERTTALRRGVRTSTMCGRGRVSACRALYGDFAGAEDVGARENSERYKPVRVDHMITPWVGPQEQRDRPPLFIGDNRRWRFYISAGRAVHPQVRLAPPPLAERTVTRPSLPLGVMVAHWPLEPVVMVRVQQGR